MKIISNEFIFLPSEKISCHASHFISLGGGKIYAVWFYGSAEGNDDVCIYGSRRNEKGVWSEPARLSEDDGQPHWNPVLFKRRDGSVMLFYKVGKPIGSWHTKIKISLDECETFSDSYEMVPGDTSGGRGPVRNKAIYLSDGSILCGGSTEKDEWKCFFDRSTDEGETWTRTEDVALDPSLLSKYDSVNAKGIIQPTMWESAPGKIHALLRSTEGRIFRTDSGDYGTTFCKPYPTSLPNNNSGIDLEKLPDGRLVLACNPVSGNWGKRTPLSLLVSEDGGVSFQKLTDLVTGDGKFAYPAVRYEDGDVLLTYTWNRLMIGYMRIKL